MSSPRSGACARSPASTGHARSAPCALVACLFTVNFGAALYPLSDPRSDYWRHYNAEAIARRGEVDLIVTSCSWLCGWYLRYFTKAEVLSPASTDPEVLRARIAQTDPARVLISSLAYAPHPLFAVEKRAAANPAWTAAFAESFAQPGDLNADPLRQRFFTLADGKRRTTALMPSALRVAPRQPAEEGLVGAAQGGTAAAVPDSAPFRLQRVDVAPGVGARASPAFRGAAAGRCPARLDHRSAGSPQ